jgi:ABC-type sugar transport system substrate-binding protein
MVGGCGSNPGGDSGNPQTSAGAGGDVDKPLAGMKVAVSPYWLDAGNLLLASGVETYLEGKGAEVTVFNPDGDAEKQRNDINTFVTDRYDAVVLCPVNTASSVPLLTDLQEAGIPTALFWNVPSADEMGDRHAPVFELNDHDSFKAAALNAVEYVTQTMKQDPKAIILDDPSNPVLHARAVGFQEGLEAADPKVEILWMDTADFTQDGARAKMADLLVSYPEVNIIAPPNGESALGVYSALRAAGRGEAVDHVSKTEYLVLTDTNNALVELMLDPSTSAVDLVQVMQLDGGAAIGKKIEEMLNNPDWINMDSREVTPSRLMSHECEAAAQEFASQNSVLDDFTPIDCSKNE